MRAKKLAQEQCVVVIAYNRHRMHSVRCAMLHWQRLRAQGHASHNHAQHRRTCAQGQAVLRLQAPPDQVYRWLFCTIQHALSTTQQSQHTPPHSAGPGVPQGMARLERQPGCKTLAQANPDPGAPTASAPAARCHAGVASATEAAAGASARAPGAPGAASVPPRTCQRGARARPSARPAARPPRWPAGGL